MKMSVPKVIKEILLTLEKSGYEGWIVGGAVRDILLGKKVLDWDLATDAKPDQVLPLFTQSFYDNNFGTVMVAGKYLKKQFDNKSRQIADESVVDITTYRSEHGYSDKRRPDSVTWGKNIEEDLKRRDFTINAMALQVLPKVKILDPYNGQKDLKNKTIRAVGDPNIRFEEDALRMMRAIRFSSELGFKIESKTLAAINSKSSNLASISWERIGSETMKIMASDYPADGILMMDKGGLIKTVIPELLKSKNVDQAGHHIYDVYTHMVESLRACPSPDPVVRLATLLHDIDKPTTLQNRGKGKEITFYNHEVVGARTAKNIAKRLRLSKKDQNRIFTLVRWHMFTYDPKMTDAAIRRLIRNVGKENIHEMMMLRVGDRIGGGSKATSWRLNELQKRIGEQLYKPLSIADLKVTGRDVMKILKISPGPKVGKILQILFEEVIEDSDKNTKKYLESRIMDLT